MEAVVRRRQRRFNFRGSLCIPYFVFMALFVVAPLAIIVYYAFTDQNGLISLESWKTVFTTADIEINFKKQTFYFVEKVIFKIHTNLEYKIGDLSLDQKLYRKIQ